MDAQGIPQELVDILDRDAGRKHSRSGSVLASLARILTRYDEIRAAPSAQSPCCYPCHTSTCQHSESARRGPGHGLEPAITFADGTALCSDCAIAAEYATGTHGGSRGQ